MIDYEKLTSVLAEKSMIVLEEMCFMFPEDDLPEEKMFSPEALVCVPFTGAVSGRMNILAYGSIMAEIALNMAGDEQMEREKQLDALGEFGNVLCGNLLPAVSEGSHFSIAEPEVSEIETEPEWDSSAPKAEFVFPDGKIRISLCIDK